MNLRRTKNGARECPYCGAILDPGEKCDCGGKPREEIYNTCEWCGSKIVGPEINLAIDDGHYKICFRCCLAIYNVRNQRKELRKTQW